MTAKHTPGEWHVETFSAVPLKLGSGYFIHSIDQKCEIARLFITGDMAEFADSRNAEANARLIAAAPEMLKVCENLTAQIKATVDPENWETVSAENTGIVKALAIIRKARGE